MHDSEAKNSTVQLQTHRKTLICSTATPISENVLHKNVIFSINSDIQIECIRGTLSFEFKSNKKPYVFLKQYLKSWKAETA